MVQEHTFENHWDVTILFSDALTIARNNRCSGRLHCVCAYFSALAILLKPRESWKRNAPRFLFRLGVMETLRQYCSTETTLWMNQYQRKLHLLENETICNSWVLCRNSFGSLSLYFEIGGRFGVILLVVLLLHLVFLSADPFSDEGGTTSG